MVSGRITIQIRPSEKNLWSRTNATCDLVAQAKHVLDVSAHVADRSDAVCKEQRQNKLAASGWLAGAGEVNVHVSEPGDQEFPCGIETSSAARNRGRTRWSERGDPLTRDDQFALFPIDMAQRRFGGRNAVQPDRAVGDLDIHGCLLSDDVSPQES